MIPDAEPVEWERGMTLDLALPFRPRCMLMCSNNTAIDMMNLPIDLAYGLCLVLKFFEKLLPETTPLPTIETT